jgi:hypothetical protein
LGINTNPRAIEKEEFGIETCAANRRGGKRHAISEEDLEHIGNIARVWAQDPLDSGQSTHSCSCRQVRGSRKTSGIPNFSERIPVYNGCGNATHQKQDHFHYTDHDDVSSRAFALTL